MGKPHTGKKDKKVPQSLVNQGFAGLFTVKRLQKRYFCEFGWEI